MDEGIIEYPDMSVAWVLGMVDLWLSSESYPENMRLRYKCNHDGILEVADEIWILKKLKDFICKRLDNGEEDIHMILTDFYWYMLKKYDETSVLSPMKHRYSAAANLPEGIYEDWDLACQEGDWL